MPSVLGSIKTVPVNDLGTFPGNPRKGNVSAVAGSLEANGQYRPLVVQKGTNIVLAGNHTLMAARSLGWETVAITYVDVDDETAKRIVLVDNRSNDLATYDADALANLLLSVDDLVGTGYNDDDLAKLTGADDLLTDGGDQSDDLTSSWAIVVTCRDEAQQLELIQRFHDEGLECRTLVA